MGDWTVDGNLTVNNTTTPSAPLFTTDEVLESIGVGAAPTASRIFGLASDWKLNPGAGIEAVWTTNDILTDALTVPTGCVQYFYGGGSTYTGNVPGSYSVYKYGMFVVYRRSSSYTMVFAIPCNSTYQCALNTYYGSSSTWNGWHYTGSYETSTGDTSYMKLNRNVIMQWGTSDLTSMSLSQVNSTGIYFGTKNFQFPVAFNNTKYYVSGCTRYSTGHVLPIGFTVIDSASAQISVYDFYARSGTIVLKWFAIGTWQ